MTPHRFNDRVGLEDVNQQLGPAHGQKRESTEEARPMHDLLGSEEELGFLAVARGAVHQFAWQPAAAQNTLTVFQRLLCLY